jgi:hypothetical protein
VNTIAVLVVIFFLVGVSRAWELIGGPEFGFTHEISELIRHPHGEAEASTSEGAGDRPHENDDLH